MSGQGINSTVITCRHHDIAGGGSIRFSSCENVSIAGVTFTGCGEDNPISIELIDDDMSQSALSFDVCKDVSLTGVHVTQSLHSAVTLNSCTGLVALRDSFFTNNNNEESVACSNGGAVSIMLTNNADEREDESIVEIESCVFTGNYANTGGAVYVEISQSLSNSRVSIDDSLFNGNSALPCDAKGETFVDGGTGGALSLFVSSPSQASLNNTITIINSSFTSNTAISGAGVHYFIWNKVQQHLPVLSIVSSVFDRNKGNTGSAVVISPVKIEPGFHYWVYFNGNIFIDNTVQSNGIHTGVGTVFVRSINIQFTGMHEFLGNQGSAIVALNAVLTFQSTSETRFISNVGFNGGALQLYGESVLLISSNVSLVFTDNLAMNQGGAIYHSTYDTFLKLPRECFIRYIDQDYSKDQIYGVITFRDNMARNETNAIYSNAILDCITSNNETDVGSIIFCQSSWVYVFSNCSESVNSEPLGFVLSNLTNRFDLFSGVRKALPVTITNVFGMNLIEEVVLSASTGESDEVSTNPSSGLILNNTIELNGRENTLNDVYVQTTNLPFVGVDIPYRIKPCPPGFLPESEDSHRCKCVENSYTQGAIICNNKELVSQLVVTNCISEYGKNDSILVFGSCQFLFGSATAGSIQLPQDPSQVEEAVCGPLNRQGILCGECKEEYSLAAYSYLFTCAKCDNKFLDWVIYIAFQYLPIVILFFLILFLNLTFISPASNAFLFVSQVTSISNAYGFGLFIAKYAFGETKGSVIVKAYNTIYGMSNLDFFRAFAPPICLFEEQNALYVTFIEYIAAFFPFVLVLLTYFVLILYSKNFRVLIWLWKPIKSCLNKVHVVFKPRTSLVDTFVTLFVLSYLKIVSITFRFLQYVFVYDINGEIVDIAFYYDGNIKVFEGIHLPFGILAIITIFTIVLFPPLVLTCYQFKWFQKILEKLHLRTQALVTFVEVLQSGLTDGRDGTKDRRFFAGFYFILRIVIFGPATVVPDPSTRIFVPLLGYAIGIMALVVFQPYQNSFFNKLDVLFLVNIMFSSFVVILLFIVALSGGPGSAIAPLLYISYILGFIPLVYMIAYVVRWAVTTSNIQCPKFRKGNSEQVPVVERQSLKTDANRKKGLFSASNYSVPDRIIQPELYQSLIVNDDATPQVTKSTIRGNSSRRDEPSINNSSNEISMNRTYELSTYRSQVTNNQQ